MGRRKKGSVSEQETIRAVLSDLFGSDADPDILLTHTFIERHGTQRRIVVKDNSGNVILSYDDTEIDDESSPEQFIRRKILLMVCSSCRTRLIDGEEGLCGLCESKHVMDLVRLREELADG